MTLPVWLPCPHYYWHPGFLPLDAAGGQTALLGGQTAPGIEAGGQTGSSSGQTTLRTEAGNQTATSGSQTARPLVASSSATSPTSTAPLWATREPLTLPLLQQSPSMKAVPMAPPANPHPMTTQAKRGFQLPADKLTLLATSSSLLSPLTHPGAVLWRKNMVL
jgi:hypothetical protein